MEEMLTREVVYEGFLRKSPPSEKILKDYKWHKRYFKLWSDHTLEYYKSTQSSRPMKKPIDLKHCLGMIESDPNYEKFFSKNYRWPFCINMPYRQYHLLARSSDEREKWINLLMAACHLDIDEKNPPKTPKYNKPIPVGLRFSSNIWMGEESGDDDSFSDDDDSFNTASPEGSTTTSLLSSTGQTVERFHNDVDHALVVDPEYNFLPPPVPVSNVVAGENDYKYLPSHVAVNGESPVAPSWLENKTTLKKQSYTRTPSRDDSNFNSAIHNYNVVPPIRNTPATQASSPPGLENYNFVPSRNGPSPTKSSGLEHYDFVSPRNDQTQSSSCFEDHNLSRNFEVSPIGSQSCLEHYNFVPPRGDQVQSQFSTNANNNNTNGHTTISRIKQHSTRTKIELTDANLTALGYVSLSGGATPVPVETWRVEPTTEYIAFDNKELAKPNRLRSSKEFKQHFKTRRLPETRQRSATENPSPPPPPPLNRSLSAADAHLDHIPVVERKHVNEIKPSFLANEEAPPPTVNRSAKPGPPCDRLKKPLLEKSKSSHIHRRQEYQLPRPKLYQSFDSSQSKLLRQRSDYEEHHFRTNNSINEFNFNNNHLYLNGDFSNSMHENRQLAVCCESDDAQQQDASIKNAQTVDTNIDGNAQTADDYNYDVLVSPNYHNVQPSAQNTHDYINTPPPACDSYVNFLPMPSKDVGNNELPYVNMPKATLSQTTQKLF